MRSVFRVGGCVGFRKATPEIRAACKEFVHSEVSIGNKPDFVSIVCENEKRLAAFRQGKCSQDEVSKPPGEAALQRFGERRCRSLVLLDGHIKAVLDVHHIDI